MLKKLAQWLMEHAKAASDIAVLFILRGTSEFGRELNDEGKAEQVMWREQRLRNLRGLAVKSLRRGKGGSN
ncbi:MAG: hypothetical protein O6918_00485 [Deltaproteobacteria bacterium]|nr:hypothetical protein [Deltaproteobacteria bacterium]MCZ6906469.1 hypothetical protein [Deltaproteobacteria bacterium]